MTRVRHSSCAIAIVVMGFFLQGTISLNELCAQQREVPEALQPWKSWATWDLTTLNSPPSFSDARAKMPLWPGRLTLTAGANGADWKFSVTVFDEAWLPLPGSNEHWPQSVVADGVSLPVVEKNARPSVRLLPGRHELSGQFKWNTMPQRVQLPPEIGLLTLIVNNETVEAPNWEASGALWLTRKRIGETEADSISVNVYRLFEDGIPTWLRTELELTVSGKSREEELGWVLPEGWKLATVESGLPISIDDRGRAKVQVRAGKWTVSLHSFRTSDERSLRFSPEAQPMVNLELIGFKANPEFRLAEFTGLQPVDVTQTSYPQRWQGLPVFQWNTAEAITLEEKQRGMGMQRPAGLAVTRHLWLDEAGQGFVYHDQVIGYNQQIWRLDVAPELELGSVRVNGTGQLITASPIDNAQGVEIRTRNLNIEAIGRMPNMQEIKAIGWRADADHLAVNIDLPPGWRALAVFGADSVQGDWLTAWSLLDLFLLLIFAAAVFRLFGFWAGLVALLAFGLSYHEPGATRFLWLFMVVKVAMLQVVKHEKGRQWISVWRFVAAGILALFLIPFLWSQLQIAIYPQLEYAGVNYRERTLLPAVETSSQTAAFDVEFGNAGEFPWANVPDDSEEYELSQRQISQAPSKAQFEQNLQFDPKAQIQTGPARPEWSWNQVRCSWSGPVSAEQKIRPILLSLNQHRVLTVIRIALIVLLGLVLAGGKRLKFRSAGRNSQKAAGLLVFAALMCGPLQGVGQEIPDAQTLQLLAERLQQTSDAFPNAAVIPMATLKVDGNRVELTAEVHTAVEVAVPLPGRLPHWSPVSVTVAGQSSELVCRKDGYLWIVLPQGVHQVVVQSLLPDVSDWEWTYLLKPKLVAIEASDWTVTGVREDGTPEQQVFFARKERTVAGAAGFDRRDFSAIVSVKREIEAGLVWQVRNQVTRLSKKGRAVSIKVPLLPGENVLTSNVVVDGGFIEVRFGADDTSFSWVSELPRGKDLMLKAPATDQWIEQWHLVTSPVWNVTRTGLAPIFQADESDLIPVWLPWPNEEATLAFSEPTAIVGATTTIQRVMHSSDLGHRQQTGRLSLEVESSLGGEFPVSLEVDSEITAVFVKGRTIPVRRVGEAVVIPVQPGKQSIVIEWRVDKSLQTIVEATPVKLPFSSANVTVQMNVPGSQWILWANGPTMGPAIRFWVILAFAILAGLILGRIKDSPLGTIQWILLMIGLTQIHVLAAAFVVVWLFALSLRSKFDPTAVPFWRFNVQQVLLVLLTIVALAVLVFAVSRGLLGDPEMFIAGNGSYGSSLKWFQPSVESALPQPSVVSVSVWYFRLLMLLWSLWLALALLGWLSKGWSAFVSGGVWRARPKSGWSPNQKSEEIK